MTDLTLWVAQLQTAEEWHRGGLQEVSRAIFLDVHFCWLLVTLLLIAGLITAYLQPASFPLQFVHGRTWQEERKRDDAGSDKGMELEVEVPPVASHHHLEKREGAERTLWRESVNTKKCEILLFSTVDWASRFMHTSFAWVCALLCVCVMHACVWVSEA